MTTTVENDNSKKFQEMLTQMDSSQFSWENVRFLFEIINQRLTVAEEAIESHDESIDSIETEEDKINTLTYEGRVLVLLLRGAMSTLASVIAADEAVILQAKGLVQTVSPDGTPAFDYAPTVTQEARTARNSAIAEAMTWLQEATAKSNEYPIDAMAGIPSPIEDDES